MPGEVLTLAERKRLRAKKIKKHGLANIVTHWFNAASWFVLLLTGLGILGNPNLKLMPQGYIDFMKNLFGGIGGLVETHKLIGLIWMPTKRSLVRGMWVFPSACVAPALPYRHRSGMP